MTDLKQYGYIEAETPPMGLTRKGYGTSARSIYLHHPTGEVTVVLEGTF